MPSAGLLNINKPGGVTSHDVVNRLRKLSGIRRIGHAGTLDPLATGVLLVCLGRATRLLEYLIGQPKTYTAVIHLGQSTNTYDADGEVVSQRPLTCTIDEITQALAQFRGDIQQLPPLYSAIKIKGQPMYKLARRGVAVERQPRPVTIYALDIVTYTPPFLEIEVTCSSGTYLRSLAHDLGEVLGCGGHISALRRTAVADFKLETAVSLEHLTPENLDTFLLPLDTAVRHLPRLQLSQAEAVALWQGKAIAVTHDQSETKTVVRAYAADGTFIGLVRREQQLWLPHKMFPPA
jgi:tRNA pseudouridine55 synthase